MPSKQICLCFFIAWLIVLSVSSASIERQSKSLFSRLNLSLLGLGPRCRGCPNHFCDDDPGVVLGYCCGCARYFDNLPVICSPYLKCPINPYMICEQYEYMMHCCC